MKSDGLKAVPETLLIPLWARSVEARHPNPVLLDLKAVELVNSLDFDFDRIAKTTLRPVEICMRAAIIDGFVQRFLDAHPCGKIVEIGPGLDTRFERLDNGSASWIELDLPETMAIRRQTFEETERRRFITTSVLDTPWLDTVVATTPSEILFVAEGVFYYFDQTQIIALLERLSDRFAGSSIVFDSQSRIFKQMTSTRTNRAAKLQQLRWHLGSTREIECWNAKFRVEENAGFGDSPYYDSMMHRMQWYVRLARRVFPGLREFFRVTRVRLG